MTKNHHLKKVICRIDFKPPINSLDNEIPTAIRKRALKYYPIEEPRTLTGKHLLLSPKADDVKANSFSEKHWHFFDKTRQNSCVFKKEAMYIQNLRHLSFEELSSSFLDISGELVRTFPDSIPSRIGLRYINEIEFEESSPFDWSNSLDKDVTSLIESYRDKGPLARAFSNVEFNHDSYNLRFQFGMPNPDYPAEIKKKFFVLDYDAYHEGIFDLHDMPSLLNSFHDKILELYKASTTDRFREQYYA